MQTKAAILISLLALQGCAAIGNMSTEEKAWQAMNIIDGMQTMNIARNPKCFYERDSISRSIIGDHPSEAEAAALMVGYGVAHYYVSRLLEDNAPKWANKVWQYTMIGTKGFTIASNHNIGLPVMPEDIRGCQ